MAASMAPETEPVEKADLEEAVLEPAAEEEAEDEEEPERFLAPQEEALGHLRL